ncbi:siderophore biosynthesis protein [Bacteroidia bacterium]|nr:siderophore biosynthesis protein [Bacteroidia bacterium]GHT29448.1 siderophore biosynthesis protein [Bacteroidia bacterium]GHV70986.1 siderophore biosynthesis protein [Bacteroidia bacterium]
MEYRSKQLNESLIGVAPILGDSELLLSQLDKKNKYLPFLEKMAEHRKREWLSVRVLLKEMLGEEKEILYLPSGKPYLADHSGYIGISHTKLGIAGQARSDKLLSGYVALILNKDEEVAIDIERISSRIKNIRSRFVNEAEEQSLSKANEMTHLLLYWSAKESIFKRLDAENVDFKTQLHIAPFEPFTGEWSSFKACETRTEKQHTFTVNYFVHKDYVLTCI